MSFTPAELYSIKPCLFTYREEGKGSFYENIFAGRNMLSVSTSTTWEAREKEPFPPSGKTIRQEGQTTSNLSSWLTGFSRLSFSPTQLLSQEEFERLVKEFADLRALLFRRAALLSSERQEALQFVSAIFSRVPLSSLPVEDACIFIHRCLSLLEEMRKELLERANSAKEWLALARDFFPNQQLSLPKRFIRKALPRENEIDLGQLLAASWVRAAFSEEEGE